MNKMKRLIVACVTCLFLPQRFMSQVEVKTQIWPTTDKKRLQTKAYCRGIRALSIHFLFIHVNYIILLLSTCFLSASELKVTFTSMQVTTTSVTISWIVSAGKESFIHAFDVEWTQVTGGGLPRQQRYSGTIRSATEYGLTPGRAYNVKVTSVINQTQAVSESTFSVTTRQATKPDPPTYKSTEDLNVVGNDKTISFSWNAPIAGFARGFLVSVTNFTYSTQPQHFTGTSAQISDSRFKNGATYIIEIVSISESVENKPDQQSEPLLWPIKTDVQVPSAPLNITCIERMDTSITLAWASPLEANGELVRYNIEAKSSNSLINVSTPGVANTFTVEGLSPGTYYIFDVTTENEKFNSSAAKTPDNLEACKTKEKILNDDTVTKASNIEMIVGVSTGVSAIIIVVVVIVIVFLRRKMIKQPTENMSVHYAKEKKVKHRPVRLSDFSNYLNYLKKDSNLLFSAEYEEMESRNPNHSTNAANLPENRSKNRLPNIVPYDHSRVKLSIISEDDNEDYINANYLPGYNSSREYIGCQGPLGTTVDDMWRMIWEQNVTIVVMLTLTMEGKKSKCEQYWPTVLSKPKLYGDIKVDVFSETNMGCYDVRIMRISNGDQMRELKHFHFLIWRENLAAVKHDSMLNFIKRVRESVQAIENSGPMVIHCSAGVGGTGTYIVLDHLIQFINDHGLQAKVDIFDLVLKLRNNRCHMVQTEQQYIFIHECVSKLLDERYGAHINSDPAHDVYSCLQADTMQGNSVYEELSNI